MELLVDELYELTAKTSSESEEDCLCLWNRHDPVECFKLLTFTFDAERIYLDLRHISFSSYLQRLSRSERIGCKTISADPVVLAILVSFMDNTALI